jgi:hypothetical protein
MLVSLRQMEEVLNWLVENLGATMSVTGAKKHIQELRGVQGNKVMELDSYIK